MCVSTLAGYARTSLNTCCFNQGQNEEALLAYLTLIRMIFDYWCFWMTCPEDSVNWSKQGGNTDKEGLFWYDGYNASFWYLLNVEWYRMENRLTARTDNTEVFDPDLRDFDSEYLRASGYK